MIDLFWWWMESAHEGKVPPPPEKRALVETYVQDIKRRRNTHQKEYQRLHSCENWFIVFIQLLNFISVSSLFIGGVFGSIFGLVVAAAIVSVVANILNVVNNNLRFRERAQSYQTAASQYANLHRHVRAILARNHLQPSDFQKIIEDITSALEIIEDFTGPVEGADADGEMNL